MAQSGAKTLPKIGVVAGIVIIAGSVLGGVALAGVPARVPGGDAGTAQPLGTEQTPAVAPSATAARTGAATGGDSSRSSRETTVSTGTAAVSTADTPPAASPTCWNGPGEHPPGIEDCEDR